MIKILSLVLLTTGISGFVPEHHKNWKLLRHDICGQTDSNRIIGGQEAPMNGYPWIARIAYKSPNLNIPIFTCGGVVATSKTILTAAHCVSDLKRIRVAFVRLGEHNTQTNPDCKNGICADPVLDIPVSEVVISKYYDNVLLKNDIALMRLKNEIKFSAFVKPICFGGSEFQKRNFLGTVAEVAGWGVYDLGIHNLSTTLQFIKLKVVDNDVCQSFLPRNSKIGSTQLCVGGKVGVDSCSGDSGGPLMKVDDSPNGPRYYLLGIVSFGATNCGSKMPGVYTKVSEYMEWILNNLEKTASDSTRP